MRRRVVSCACPRRAVECVRADADRPRPSGDHAVDVVGATELGRHLAQRPTGSRRPSTGGVLHHGALVGREGVEPGRHEAPQRVGQSADARASARRLARRWPSASAACWSPSSATSSSRKNGLPPLRSSSASRELRRRLAAERATSSSSAGRVAVERIEVEHRRVVAAGRRAPTSVEQAGRAVAEQHERAAAASRSSSVSISSSTSVVGPVQVGQHDDDRAGGGRDASMNATSERDAFLAGTLVGSMLVERGLVAHEVEQAVGDPLDLGVGGAVGRTRRATALGGRRLGPTSAASSGVDAAGLAQRLGDRPPHVGLAVGHAPALEHDGARASHAAQLGDLLGQPASCPRRPRRRAGSAGPGGGSTAASMACAEQAELGVAADERDVARAGAGGRAAASGSTATQASTGSSRPLACDRPERLVAR